MKEDQRTERLAHGALLCGLVTGATLISFPVPGFRLYCNLGEGVLYSIALLEGRKMGALCGALGAAMADLLLGYTLWAPFTFLIKGAEGYVTGALASQGSARAVGCGAAVMILGYVALAGCLYGPAAAPVELVTDLVQCGIGAAAALYLEPILKKRLQGLGIR